MNGEIIPIPLSTPIWNRRCRLCLLKIRYAYTHHLADT